MKNLIIINESKNQENTSKILADYLHKAVYLEGFSMDEKEIETKIEEFPHAENIIISINENQGKIKGILSAIKNKAYRFLVFSVMENNTELESESINSTDKTARESAMIIAYKVKQKTM